MAHPDAPGVWADGVFPLLRHPTEPSVEYVRQVMSSGAAAVVDPNKLREDGDPYVLALALQLIADGHKPCIVTDDVKDNPVRISMLSACRILTLRCCPLQEFLLVINL